MADKKKQPEDNRDVFEKALDNWPALVGAAAGGALGRYSTRTLPKAKVAELRKAQRDAITSGNFDDARIAHFRQWKGTRDRPTNTMLGAVTGGSYGAFGSKVAADQKKRRK